MLYFAFSFQNPAGLQSQYYVTFVEFRSSQLAKKKEDRTALYSADCPPIWAFIALATGFPFEGSSAAKMNRMTPFESLSGQIKNRQ